MPATVQAELWPGFDRLLEGQEAFLEELQSASADSELRPLYQRKIELCEAGLLVYLGNIPRALSVLLDLTANNKTWKVYMEGAIMDVKARKRQVHTFVVMPRVHMNKLMTLMSPFESGKTTVLFLENFEQKARNIAGRPAAEDDGKKKGGGVPGLGKLKVVDETFLDRPLRRLLREGKFLMQASGGGKGSAKKKAKELGYWLCDDGLFWANINKGPAKHCIRLKYAQMRIEALDEGGYVIDLNDPGLNSSVGILCNDEQTKQMWELDINDWTMYCIDVDRRNRREEALRIQEEAEKRQREEIERLRKVQEAQKEEAERVRKMHEAQKVEADRIRKIQESQRVEEDRIRKQQEEAMKRSAPPSFEPSRGESEAIPPPSLGAVPPLASSPPRRTTSTLPHRAPELPAVSLAISPNNSAISPPSSPHKASFSSPLSSSTSTIGMGVAPAPPAHVLPPPVVFELPPPSRASASSDPPVPMPQKSSFNSNSSPSIPQLPSKAPAMSPRAPPRASPRSSLPPTQQNSTRVTDSRKVPQPAQRSPTNTSSPHAPLRHSGQMQLSSSPAVGRNVIPGWEKDPNTLGKAVAEGSGPRMPQKRAEAPPPWAQKK